MDKMLAVYSRLLILECSRLLEPVKFMRPRSHHSSAVKIIKASTKAAPLQAL